MKRSDAYDQPTELRKQNKHEFKPYKLAQSKAAENITRLR